jgi:hypothetical protein
MELSGENLSRCIILDFIKKLSFTFDQLIINEQKGKSISWCLHTTNFDVEGYSWIFARA